MERKGNHLDLHLHWIEAITQTQSAPTDVFRTIIY